MANGEKGVPCDFHPYEGHTWAQLHAVVVDKEYQLECMKDELQRLSLCEQESARKDEVIRTLRKEIAEYKKCTQNRDLGFAALKDQLSSTKSHLQERIKDIQKLQSEVEGMQEEQKLTARKYSSAQRELSKLSQVHSEETRNLRLQHSSDSETIASLRRELAEKRSHSSTTQEKVKKFRSENQELQKRVEMLQAERDVAIASEKKLKSEIAKLKSLTSNGQLWQAKYELNEQELLKAKDKENSLLADLGRLESELSELRSHILASFAQHEASSESVFHLVTQFTESHHKMEERLALTEQDLEKHEEEKSALISDVTHLCESWKPFQVGVNENVAGAITLLVENLQKVVLEDDTVQELLDMMKGSIGALQCLTEGSYQKLLSLENHIKSCCHSQTEGEDAMTMVTNVVSSLRSAELEISKLKEKLVEMDLEHTASLTGAVTALRQDEKTRLDDAITKSRAEEKEKRSNELKHLKEGCLLEKQEAVLHEQEIAAALRRELEDLKQAINSEAEERSSLQAKLDETDAKLVATELSRSQAVLEADELTKTLEQQFTDKLEEYKEQAQQYALTIVAMEKKLLNMMESCKALQTENSSLKTELNETNLTNTENIKSRDEKISKMEELIRVLRNQLQLASVDGGQKEATMHQMEKQIHTLNVSATETRAHLEEQHQREISDLQLTMAKQETVIECQKTEIENLTEEVHRTASELAGKSQQCDEIAEELKQVQKRMEEIEAKSTKQNSHLTLTEAGHVCLGERHCEIICNQRTAIAQLRERVAELEQAKPPIGSHQATLKELSRVRHELLKVKSSLPRGKLNEGAATKPKDEQASKPQFSLMDPQPGVALEQMEEALQCSERTYKNLVEVICQELPGVIRYPLESEDQLTASDEQAKKKQVLKGRKKFADTVCKQLSRQAKLSAAANKGSIEDKPDFTDEDSKAPERTPEEVIADLETMLAATAEELEQQKKLNQSLLKRKNFKEAQLVASMQRPRHVCN